jgi:four helix bundle protein
MGDHRKLKVWQEARILAGKIYLVTLEFPSEEKFGLIMPCQRAAASIMSNLAEGCGRNGDRELLRFVGISRGSASELDSHLTIASDVGMADAGRLEAIQSELSKIRAMLARLAKRLSDGLSDSDSR